MAIGGRGWSRLDLRQRALEDLLTSADGPVARHLQQAAEAVTQEAKRLAPVSPDGSNGRGSGYLRSNIQWTIDEDGEGLYADIASTATTPEGAPYGLFVEVGTVAHPIVSKGPWPLRDRRGNVFGRRVQHPGTRPQPYLRPALDVLR